MHIRLLYFKKDAKFKKKAVDALIFFNEGNFKDLILNMKSHLAFKRMPYYESCLTINFRDKQKNWVNNTYRNQHQKWQPIYPNNRRIKRQIALNGGRYVSLATHPNRFCS